MTNGKHKAKANKAKNNPTRLSRYAHFEWKAGGKAERLGLFILSEGPPDDPTWRIYSRETGACVLSYWPANLRWLAAGRSGTCACFWEALERAAGMVNPPKAAPGCPGTA